MKNIKKFLAIFIATISLTGIVYGAGTLIERLDQTVSQGDIITSTWYNAVNNFLKGPHTEGGVCSYSAGKILCNGTGGGGGNTTPNAKYFIIPKTELAKFHMGCTNGNDVTFNCLSAAHRYCTDACIKSNDGNCNGGVSGLNFVSGFVVEANDTIFGVTCVK